MTPRTTLTRLLVAALVLPISLSVVWAVAHLLQEMGDDLWAHILNRVALVGSIVWAIDLVCLLIALAVHAITPSDGSSDSTGD